MPTTHATLLDCFNECKSKDGVGFFSYERNHALGNCRCHQKVEGCKQDASGLGTSYEILFSNNSGTFYLT